MPLLGQLALWLALLLGVWGAVIGLAGGRLDRPDLQESARRATIAVAAALLVAVAALVVAVLRHDFRVAYVAAHADRTLAPRDTWGVLLEGIAGRLLVCTAAAAVCLAVARHIAKGSDRRALAHAVGLATAAVALAVAVLLVAANPFALLSYTPIDGQGLSQRLYGSATQLHLAFLYGGVGSVVVPAAWTLAARLVGEGAADWDRARRRWLRVAWVLLTVAAALGLWADYHARGWHGPWLAHALRGVALPAWGVLTLVVHIGARSPVRVGAHVAHAGGALFALGLLGAAFRTTGDVELRTGESAPAGRYSPDVRRVLGVPGTQPDRDHRADRGAADRPHDRAGGPTTAAAGRRVRQRSLCAGAERGDSRQSAGGCARSLAGHATGVWSGVVSLRHQSAGALDLGRRMAHGGRRAVDVVAGPGVGRGPGGPRVIVELLLGGVLVALAVGYVLRPVLRPRAEGDSIRRV